MCANHWNSSFMLLTAIKKQKNNNVEKQSVLCLLMCFIHVCLPKLQPHCLHFLLLFCLVHSCVSAALQNVVWLVSHTPRWSSISFHCCPFEWLLCEWEPKLSFQMPSEYLKRGLWNMEWKTNDNKVFFLGLTTIKFVLWSLIWQVTAVLFLVWRS